MSELSDAIAKARGDAIALNMATRYDSPVSYPRPSDYAGLPDVEIFTLSHVQGVASL